LIIERTPEWDWEKLRASCHREARRLVRDPLDADDAVQEALARGWRSRERCRTPEQPLPWLLQITRNESLRLLERRRRRELRTGEHVDPLAWATSSEDGDRVALALDVDRALAQLPPADRVLARLRYHEDLPQTRIADLLGTPDATIRVRLHRLRDRLRHELSELR
jgi:RNA polymerase sigma-70 factor (ECF subfamily)